MNDSESTNTPLALAGAALSLQSELLEVLLEKKIISAPEALLAVRRARAKLEAPGQPGGIRASVYLEAVEEDVQRRMPG